MLGDLPTLPRPGSTVEPGLQLPSLVLGRAAWYLMVVVQVIGVDKLI